MFVYFIQSEMGGPVKIGFATNPKSRLMHLQISNPFTLRIHAAIPAERALEASLHDELRHYWVRGEWFSACEEVEAKRIELVESLGSEWNRKLAITRRLSPREMEWRMRSAKIDEAHEQSRRDRELRAFDSIVSKGVAFYVPPDGSAYQLGGHLRCLVGDEIQTAKKVRPPRVLKETYADRSSRLADCPKCGGAYVRGAAYAAHYRRCA